MLPDADFDAYLAPMTPDQAASIRAIRDLLKVRDDWFVEAIDDGKWFGGLLTYYTLPDNIFAFALGPRANGMSTFHMMSYYCSEDLKARHGAALKKFESGKSCIKFKTFDELPEGVIEDIISRTPTFVEIAKKTFANREKKSSRKS